MLKFPVAARWALAGAAAFLGAAALSAPPGKKGDPLIEADMAANQPRPINQVMVDLKPGVGAQAFAALYNLEIVRPMMSWNNGWVMRGGTPESMARLVPALRKLSAVEEAHQDRLVFYKKSQFIPNDVYFPNEALPGQRGQWHLHNTANHGGAGIDARVFPAWQRGLTGLGVTIGIVDDSLEMAHPDLLGNVSGLLSYDFGQNDFDPSPVLANDNHGTPVAGVAAARGGNITGVTGAAPLATLAGLRVQLSGGSTALVVSQLYDATLYKSSHEDTSIKIKNHSYGYNFPYTNADLELNALSWSGFAGTIHVFAAGNERNTIGGDSAFQATLSDYRAIAVAALGIDGKFASYSNFGANVFVTAPSSATFAEDILTTDAAGAAGRNSGASFPDADYTFFGGTSSSAPLVAGVLALAKEIRPNMDSKFAKHLLAISSDVVDPNDFTPESDGGWKTNGAGLKFNQNYGFGLINADKLTANARLYSGVHPFAVGVSEAVDGRTIPDASPNGLEWSLAVPSGFMEEAQITLEVTHPFRGDIEAYLTSPSGTTGRLMKQNPFDSGDNFNWTFTSNLFWGEDATGTWHLRVVDTAINDVGTLNKVRFSLHLSDGLIPVTTVSGFTVNPSSVGGGGPTVGTLTLSNPAPPGGIQVEIRSNRPEAQPPAVVTLAEGAVTTTFIIPTSRVTTDTPAVLTARFLGRETSANMTIERMKMFSVLFDPFIVKGGTGSLGQVQLNAPAPAGGQVVTLSSNRTSVVVPPSVTVPAGFYSATFPITTTFSSAQVLATIVGSTNFTSKFGVLTVDPPYVSSVLLNPGILAGGASSAGRVNLDAPAPAGGYMVNLTSNRAAVTVPATVTVPAGATLVNFPVTTVPVPLLTQATITATVAGRARFSVLNVEPPPLIGHTISPGSVLGGVSATGTVTIQSPAPAPGVVVTIISNRAAVQAPATVTIPTGQTSRTYTLTTSQTQVPVAATVYAQFYNRSRFATLTVNPPAIISHTASPATVTGGSPSTGTITLDNPAPPGGLTATMTSNRAAVQVPATVTIPAGATSANYNITTSSVGVQTQATLVANINGRTRFVVVTVNP